MAKGKGDGAHGIEETNAVIAERDALAARVEELECAERDHRDLLACIVHDLKNPLSVIASSLDLMREQLPAVGAESGSPQCAAALGLVGEGLDEADLATRRLRLMIDDLLLVARLREVAPTLKREPIELADLLRKVTLEYHRAAQDRQIDLFAQPAQPLRVTTDRTVLLRILQKIVESSLRFTPSRGRVEVAVRAERDVQITVAHTGPAIPEAERKRLFDRLAKADGSRPRTNQSRMGLYFCKQAVNALGGDIEVVETPEWPTTFVVHIPAA